MPYLNKEAILSSLTVEDVIKVVCDLGYPDYKFDNQGNPCFTTAMCHGGDSPYKLVYYDVNDNSDRKWGLFKCYTCGDCYDVIELVIRCKRNQGRSIAWSRALYYIAKVTGKIITQDVSVNRNELITDFEWINRLKKAKNKKSRAIPILTEINENILDIFCYTPHEEWLNNNITRDALNHYEIGYYGLNNSIVIPHRDINNRLLGIRCRHLDQEDVDNIGKYVPLQIDGRFLSHQLGSNLYGINVTKDKVMQCKKIMLVEAEKSCLQAYSYFGEDSFVMGTCGSAITQTQKKIILNELKVDEIIYAPDRDYHDANSFEAEVWINKQFKKLEPFLPFARVYLIADSKDRLGYKDSPTDRGKETLLELMKEKILITKELINEYANKGTN